MILTFEKMILRLLLTTGFIFIACSDDAKDELNSSSVERFITTNTRDTIIGIPVDNYEIPVYLSIPEGCKGQTMPAVVVMHGSDGMWTNNDPSSGIMSGQFRQWQGILSENCIVSAFVDSYSSRGVLTRTGKWRELPDNFRISAQFERPKDANAALLLLQNLIYEDGTPVVEAKDIGLLGFSDGGSAVAGTMLDVDRVPEGFEWTQSQDGKDYDSSDGILPPQPKTEIGFSGAVSYYPGSVGYNYYGKHPCGSEAMDGNVFFPYAPMLYQIPSDDALTENTLCLVDLLKAKKAPIEIEFYEGVTHGFDFDGLPESETARKKTIDWFNEIWSNN